MRLREQIACVQYIRRYETAIPQKELRVPGTFASPQQSEWMCLDDRLSEPRTVVELRLPLFFLLSIFGHLRGS